MQDFINNQYVIGIVVTVVGGLLLYILFGIGRREKVSKISKSKIISAGRDISVGGDIMINSKKHNTSTPVQTDQPSHLDNTPSQIMDYLKSLKPYDRPSASKKYIGMHVKWKLIIVTIRFDPNRKREIVLSGVFANQSRIFPSVRCRIDESKFPEVRNLDENQLIEITGIIESVEDDGASININRCKYRLI